MLALYVPHHCDWRTCCFQTAADPSGRLVAVADGFGRVMVVRLHPVRVVRMFKGYRDAQVAWLTAVDRWEGQWTGAPTPAPYAADVSVGLYLALYAPPRGVVEVWRMSNGALPLRWCAVCDVAEAVCLVLVGDLIFSPPPPLPPSPPPHTHTPYFVLWCSLHVCVFVVGHEHRPPCCRREGRCLCATPVRPSPGPRRGRRHKPLLRVFSSPGRARYPTRSNFHAYRDHQCAC